LVTTSSFFYFFFTKTESINTHKKIQLFYPILEKTGIPDTVFSDELVYNYQTREVCSTIRATGAVKDYLKFVYNGRNYIVQAEMDDYKITFTLNQI